MRTALVFRLLGPVGARVARQLARPSGWFGRAVMLRALNRGNRDLIEATLEAAAPARDARLLDVGFGGGLLLERARERGLRVLAGADPSPDAVAALRGRGGRLADADLRLEIAAVEALPFDDGSFDVVASTNTIYFWPDLPAALRELRRVLRRGGTLALGFSGVAKLRRFDDITRHGFRFHEIGDVLAAATAAGFSDVRASVLHGRATEGDHVVTATG